MSQKPTNRCSNTHCLFYTRQSGHPAIFLSKERTDYRLIKGGVENESVFTIEGAEWVSSEKADSYLVFEQEKQSIKKLWI